MEGLFGLLGLVFGLSGFLAVTRITDFALNLVKMTQIHTLPLLNMIHAGWAYLAVGVLCFVIAGAMYKPQGEYWWYRWEIRG